jgi:hypothetical protein
VTVTDKDSNLIADCHFHFQSIAFTSLKEGACEPDILFFQELDKRRVEESVKVGLFVRKPQVGVISRNTIKMDLRDCGKRSDKVLGEKLSTFVDLFEPNKFQLIRLVRIDAFAINDVSEKEHEYSVCLDVSCYLGDLFGDSLKASCCFAGVPSGSSPAVVKV